MAHYTFRLPDIGEGVAEAEIVAWHLTVGEMVEEDHPMVDVMTDKATVEMTAPVAGRVLAIHGEPGARVSVGSPLIELEIEGEGEAVAAVVHVAPAPAKVAPAPPPAPMVAAAPVPLRNGPVMASPALRRRARENNIALENVPGTGRDGRITTEDMDAYLARGGAAAAQDGVTEIKIIGLRRKIADRMQDTIRRVPHFAYVEECDFTELEGLRRELNAALTPGQVRLTLLPFFMRALVKVVPNFPKLNAWFDDDAGVLRIHKGVHVGIATQTANGLLVPVVHHAERRSIWDCARELARVTAAARDGSARREELTGSTITLSSLGALGGIAATPIINAPEVAIIAPNKLVERPVVINGQVAVRMMMNLSSSFDHRIVDGHDGASFIHALKRVLERPALLFVDGQ